MDFAVVKITGKQYLVKAGDTIQVSGLLGEGKKELDLTEVLLLNLNDDLRIGTPLVDGAKLSAEVVTAGKGKKIRVAKFKAKSRYRRVMGFRPLLTTLKIVSLGAKTKESKPAESVKTATTVKSRKAKPAAKAK